MRQSARKKMTTKKRKSNLGQLEMFPPMECKIKKKYQKYSKYEHRVILSDVEKALKDIPDNSIDLIVTSPPYNLGKEYEKVMGRGRYFKWQARIISKCYKKLKETGSICWEVGYNNLLDANNPRAHEHAPLDYEFHPIFKKNKFKMKNRIIWTFGHGINNKNNFSYRHESIMWYVKSEKYKFNLDPIRILQKYPGKSGYKKSVEKTYQKVTSSVGGKNPEDVWKETIKSQINKHLIEDISVEEMRTNLWDIPNVKSHHREKANHPCQFPVALITRLVLGLTDKGDTVLDPFCGSGSAGVSCALTGRKFIGIDKEKKYLESAKERINEAIKSDFSRIRKDKPVPDHKKSRLWRDFDFDKWELKAK